MRRMRGEGTQGEGKPDQMVGNNNESWGRSKKAAQSLEGQGQNYNFKRSAARFEREGREGKGVKVPRKRGKRSALKKRRRNAQDHGDSA